MAENSSEDYNVFQKAALEVLRDKPFHSPRNVAFMRPDEFLALPENKQISVFRERLLKYLPEALSSTAKKLSDYEIKMTINELKGQGPFALGNHNADGKDTCLINENSSDLDTKDEITNALSQTASGKILPQPGTDNDWVSIIGHHEGEHCNQHASGHTGIEAYDKYQKEIGADQEAINRLRKEGKNDIADALIDIRALGASSDPVHATGVMIDQKNIPPEAFEAAQNFKDIADNAVERHLKSLPLQEQYKLGVDESSVPAGSLFKSHPQAYMQILKDQISQGHMDNEKPYVKEYQEALIGAFERRVQKDPPLAPDIGLTAIIEGNTNFLTVAMAMEELKRTGEIDPMDKDMVQQIMNDKEIQPEIISELKNRYPNELKPYEAKEQEANPETSKFQPQRSPSQAPASMS